MTAAPAFPSVAQPVGFRPEGPAAPLGAVRRGFRGTVEHIAAPAGGDPGAALPATPAAGSEAAAAPVLVVALAGPPNCGKTSLFNAITGARQRVGNFSGVTVERKSGRAATPAGRRLELIDLPGTQSLRARSPDEAVTRDVVLGLRPGEPAPDLILAVADATNPAPGIRLAAELTRTGRPVMLVLNMADIARVRGIGLDLEALAWLTGLPVTTATAVRRGGLDGFWARLDDLVAAGLPAPLEPSWTPPSAAELRALTRSAESVVAHAVTPPERPHRLSAQLDAVLLHPVAGFVILFALLFVMFQAVFAWAGPLMDGIEALFAAAGSAAAAVLPDGLLESFVVDGVIAGIGSVLVFLPQIAILFLFILLLEDLGYMSRAAFLMDRVMGGAGLHGRAFIPLLSSFACAIPGIMATRVIDSPRDRLTTILVAPLMTCSARIPVYTLIIASFVPARTVGGVVSLQGLVMFGLYAAGIVSALAVSAVLNRLVWHRQAASPFLLDLPDYKLPQPKGVAWSLWLRVRAFLVRAGTVIFWMVVVLWVLATFPRPPQGATEPAIAYSFAAMIGGLIEPLLAPVGFNWQIAVSLVPAMAAREVVVASLGTVYAVGAEGDAAISAAIAADWSMATALALLAWFVFAPQCLATLAVIRRETGSRKWMWAATAYMFALAWLAAFVTYHVARAFGLG